MPPRPRRSGPLLGLLLGSFSLRCAPRLGPLGLGALGLLGLAGLVLAPRPASASLLAPLDTAQLVARAERIVIGTVVGQESRWTDDHSTIVTDVRIRVSTAMLGAKDGEVITVRRLGGAVKDVGMRVFGEASYSDGEEVLVFAERRGEAYYSVGMTQGTLHVSTEGGKRVAQPSLSGAEIMGREKARTTPRPLGEIVQEVRGAMLARPRQGPQKAPEGKR